MGNLWALVLFCVSGCAFSLEITRLSIPSFVKNGSEESVLLDCEYSYSLKEDKKLVIKWFHENDPKPVYQWIPELDAKLFSDKFRVNEDYEIPTGNAYTRSRALNIQKPTTELSGRYSCQVQSLEGSDIAEDNMIIYALPTSVRLNYTISDGVVQVICRVGGVYPVPEMSMFLIEPGDIDKKFIDDTDIDADLDDGAYDVRFWTDIDEDDLPSKTDGLTFFGCVVELNGTNYQKEVKIPYFPNPIAQKREGNDNSENGSSSCYVCTCLISVLLILLKAFT